VLIVGGDDVSYGDTTTNNTNNSTNNRGQTTVFW